MICHADAERSVFALLRCPNCESDNIYCESTREHHEHACLDCGLVDTWRPVKR